MSKNIEDILTPKPEARPGIYAYSTDHKSHEGLCPATMETGDAHA
jgi:hypothetical protein